MRPKKHVPPKRTNGPSAVGSSWDDEVQTFLGGTLRTEAFIFDQDLLQTIP